MAVGLPDADETALNASALAGDEDALARLLTLHQPLAFNVAYRLLGREADASDAVQEASLLALRAVRGEGAPPREVDRFKAWLLRIVVNAALGEIRRRPNGSQVPLDAVAEALPGPPQSEPAHELERREARGDVLRALLVLPDAQRAALTLREFQQLSYDEIADVLGVGRPAVAQLLYRARRNFRAAYEGLAETNGPVGCPELAPLLSAMLDGEVAESAWPILQAHLRPCRRCRRELNGLRQTRRLHALIPLLAPPIGWCWGATATANAAGLAAVVTASPAAIAPAVIAPAALAAPAIVPPMVATSAAPAALGSGLLAKIAGFAAAKVAAPVVAAGLSVAVVAAPAPAFDPTDAAPAIELPSAATESVDTGARSRPVARAWVIEPPAIAEEPPGPEREAVTQSVLGESGLPAGAAEPVPAVPASEPESHLRSQPGPPASPALAADTTPPIDAAAPPSSVDPGEQIERARPEPELAPALLAETDENDRPALQPLEADSQGPRPSERLVAAQLRQDRAARTDQRDASSREPPATPLPTPRATSSPPSAATEHPLASAAMAPPTVASTPPPALMVNPTATPSAPPTQPPLASPTQPPSATPKEQSPTSGGSVAVGPTPQATVTGALPIPLATQLTAEQAELKEQIVTLKAQLTVAPAPRQAALREELVALREELRALEERLASPPMHESEAVVDRQRLAAGGPRSTQVNPTVERPELTTEDVPERKLVAALAQQPVVEVSRDSPPSRLRSGDVVEASDESLQRPTGSERRSETELESQPSQSSAASTREPEPSSKREPEPTSKREPELAPKLEPEPELAPKLKATKEDDEQSKLKDGDKKEQPKLESGKSSKAKCKGKAKKSSKGKCKSTSQKGSGEQAKAAAEPRKS